MLMYIPKIEKKIQKQIFFSMIISSELASLNSLSLGENTCDHRSMS